MTLLGTVKFCPRRSGRPLLFVEITFILSMDFWLAEQHWRCAMATVDPVILTGLPPQNSKPLRWRADWRIAQMRISFGLRPEPSTRKSLA